MLTRNKRTEVETRRKGYTKKIIVCERIQRFLSPGTNYQPYHNVYFSEEMLKDGEECTSYLGPIFDFNRIVRSSKHSWHINFELAASTQGTVQLGYIIERFKSFGHTSFKEIADSLQKIVEAGAQLYSEEEAMMFPSTEQIIEQYKDQAFIIVGGDFTPTGLVTNRLSISKALLTLMGYDDELLMLQAAKFGTVSMGDSESIEFMTLNCFDQLLSYLNSQIRFKQLVKEKNYSRIAEVIEKSTVRDRLRTYNRDKELVEWTCVMKTLTPSTLIVVFQQSAPVEPVPPPTELKGLQAEQSSRMEVEDSEYEVLQHLTFVADNCLKGYRPYVCGVKTLPSDHKS